MSSARSRTYAAAVSSASPRRVGSGSRAPSASPDRDLAPPDHDPSDPEGTLQRFSAYVEALHLRLRTTHVDCENLRRKIAELREAEPQLGAARVRSRLAQLEEENQKLHQQVAANQCAREQLQSREAELAGRRRDLGLGRRSCRDP